MLIFLKKIAGVHYLRGLKADIFNVKEYDSQNLK